MFLSIGYFLEVKDNTSDFAVHLWKDSFGHALNLSHYLRVYLQNL